MFIVPRSCSGLLVFASLLALAANAIHAEAFVAPYSGNLYIQCTGGSAGATSQFGLGAAPANFVPYLSGLPSSCPTAEVLVGQVTAGQTVPFAIETAWGGQTYWAFSTATDQGSVVSFSDPCNALGMGGKAIQQTSSTTWLMHLNDAAHYTLSQCEANNILIQIRIAATTTGPPTISIPASLPLVTLAGSSPPSTLLTVTGTFGLNFTATASSSGNWLSISPISAVTPASLSVSAGAGSLSPGTYTGTITVSASAASNSPQITQVTLTVQDGYLVTASPNGLTFSFAIGGTAQPQTISLSSPNSGIRFNATASGGSWLSVSPSTGSTPSSISVGVNPSGLALGTYTASITILASSASNPVQTIPVTLVVSPPTSPPSFTSAGIVNAASYVGGLVPGSLATLFGKGLSIVNGAVLAGGKTSLSGTSVTVGGIPAPLVSVVNQSGQEQISFQVPFELQGSTTTAVAVTNNGSSSTAANVPVLVAQPGIFAVVLSPSGTTAAVIHLNGQLVTPQNRAQAGEYVSLFLTGLGPLQPGVATGALGPIPPAMTTMPVSVSVGGVGCNVIFSGYAPENVGLYQINFQVPSNAPSGPSVALGVSAGSFAGPQSSIPIM